MIDSFEISIFEIDSGIIQVEYLILRFSYDQFDDIELLIIKTY